MSSTEEALSITPDRGMPNSDVTRLDRIRSKQALTDWMRPRWGPLARAVALSMLFLLLTLAMLRPSPSELRDTVPVNYGDPALVTWILRYGSHALVTDPLDVFNAPTFWPEENSFSFSESMLPVAPVYGLVHAIVGDDVVAMNLVIIGFFVFNLATTYALARYLVADRRASLLAAIAFSFSGYVMARSGHPHLQPVGVFSLGYLATFRMLDLPSIRRGVLAGFANAVAFLTCLYYGAIWAVCYAILIGGWLLLRRFRISRSTLVALGTMAVVSAVLILPVARVYAQRDLHREVDPGLGLNISDFLVPATGSYVHTRLDHRVVPVRIEHSYFPGAIPTALGAAGVAALAVGSFRRRKASMSHQHTDAAQVAVTAPDRDQPIVRGEPLGLICLGAVASFVLALGPELRGITMPFAFFADHVPGFSGIRVPSRLVIPAMLAGALLAGVGATAGLRLIGRRVGFAVSAVVAALMLVELAAPVPRIELDRSDEVMAVYEELARRPDGPAVELPMIDPLVGAEWPYVEAPRMVRSAVDWHPRVNGYSGGFPDGYRESAYLFNRFPASASLAHARSLGVRYVIVHTGAAASSANYSDVEAKEMIELLPPTADAEQYGAAWLVDLGEVVNEGP